MALWYPCCTQDTVVCQRCIDGNAPYYLPVTIGNVGDDDCDCSSVNGTHILTPEGTECRWIAEGEFDCDGNTIEWRLTLTATSLPLPPFHNGWAAELQIYTSGIIQYARLNWDSGSTADFDCFAQRTLTYATATTSGFPPFPCVVGSSLTCVVN